MNDLISRDSALNALEALEKDAPSAKHGSAIFDCEDTIKRLPSVEPERKPGKWIKVVNPDTNEWTGGFKCSECDRGCVQMSMDYCANCGAPMEVDG